MPTATNRVMEELATAWKELNELRRRILQLSRERGAGQLAEYTLQDRDGNPVTFSSLFGDKDDLIVIHNMGRGCRYCTLWADGFNGLRAHFEDRAAFALVSPDEPNVMREFADSRGWTFRILSNHGGSFTRDMGFETAEGRPTPGFSTFRREADGTIQRIGCADFGPGDDYCAIWHMFELLKDGPNNWEPQYKY